PWGRMHRTASPDHRVIVRMRADPEPQESVVDLDGERPIVSANPYRPEMSDFLEMEGGVLRVLLQEGVVLVGQCASALRQPSVSLPEWRAGEMPHSSGARPRR